MTLAKARVGWLTIALTTIATLLLVLLDNTGGRRASAFVLPPPYCSIQSSIRCSLHPRRATTAVVAMMISQKEKRRLAEQQDRRSALQQAETAKQQRQLVAQLRDLLLPSTTKNSKTAATAAARLLKQVAHDYVDLKDIGSEARALVLHLFYEAQRPADVLAVLSSSSVEDSDGDEEELLYAKYALWAHACNEEWQSAVPYAIRLYGDGNEKDDDSSPQQQQQQDKNGQGGNNNNSRPPFSSPHEQQRLRHAAIRALTHCTTTDTPKLARQLLQPERDGVAVMADVFASYLRNHAVDEARLFWDELEEQKQGGGLEPEMYRKLLEWGSDMADVPWMERALQALESKTDASDHLLLLQGLAAASEESKLTVDHQALVVTAMKEILIAASNKPSSKKEKGGAMLQLLDRLWLAVDQPDKQRELFGLCEQYFGNKHSWILSLPAAAKARIFPLLVEKAQDDDGEAAWKILVSLVSVKSSPEKLQSFVKKQSAEFCSAAFALLVEHYLSSEFGERLSDIIAENRWQALLPQPSDDPTESKLWKRVGCLFNFVGYAPGENKFEAFEKAIADLTMFVTTHMSTTTTTTNHKSKKEMELPPRPSFADPRRASLVDSNARFWQALVHVDSALWENAEFCFAVRLVSSAAMVLVASHTKIDIIRNDFTTRSDGQAKEAIDTIMKDLLMADLLPQNEVAAVGREYYLSLARICRTLSIDDQKCLLFPMGTKETFIAISSDPYEVFRECVLGGKSKLKAPILNFFLSWAPDGGGTNQQLALLLPSVVLMAYGEGKTLFIEEYQGFFKSFDLFLDSRLLKEFFSALGFAREVASVLPYLPNLPNRPNDEEALLWCNPLWTSQLASVVVEEVWNGQYAQKLVKDMDGVRDFGEKTSLLTGYVCNMYSVIGPFSSYSDPAGTSLYDRYRSACDRNCEYFVEYLVNQSSKELFKVLKSREQKKEAPWKRYRRSSRENVDKVVDRVVSMMELMLEQIANTFQEVDFDGDDDDDDALLPDGRHFVSLLVTDVLQNLAWQLPPERLEQFFEGVKSNKTIKEHLWLGVFVQEYLDDHKRE